MTMAMFILTLWIGLVCIPLAVHALNDGDTAPLFEAPSTEGVIRLADYRGAKNVIIAFYFADFTPV